MNKKNNTMHTATLYFSVMLAFYLLFIALASFYLSGAVTPGRAARAGAGELFFLAGEFRLRWWNLRDISTNLLLYMPLGFLVAMLLANCGKKLRAGIHLWWGVLLSIAVETGQAFIGRFSDATDVISNGGGYMLGFLIASFAVQRYSIRPEMILGLSVDDDSARLNTLSGIRFIYLTITLIATLLPFDISVSMSQIYGKLQPIDNEMPRLIADPLYHFTAGETVQYLTLKFLMFLPLAFLSAYILLQRNRISLFIPAFHCLFLGITIEGANLFVQSGRSDVVVPLLGFVAGLAIASLVAFFGRRSREENYFDRRRESQFLLISIALLYSLLLLAVALSPYEFEISLRTIRDKFLYDSNLIPLRLHFSARSIGSAVDIVREFILYVPLGAMLTLWLRRSVFQPSRQQALAAAATLGFGFALWVESLQLAVIGRYVDITDVLLATTGSLAGGHLAPLFAAVMLPDKTTKKLGS